MEEYQFDFHKDEPSFLSNSIFLSQTPTNTPNVNVQPNEQKRTLSESNIIYKVLKDVNTIENQDLKKSVQNLLSLDQPTIRASLIHAKKGREKSRVSSKFPTAKKQPNPIYQKKKRIVFHNFEYVEKDVQQNSATEIIPSGRNDSKITKEYGTKKSFKRWDKRPLNVTNTEVQNISDNSEVYERMHRLLRESVPPSQSGSIQMHEHVPHNQQQEQTIDPSKKMSLSFILN